MSELLNFYIVSFALNPSWEDEAVFKLYSTNPFLLFALMFNFTVRVKTFSISLKY